MTAASDGGMQVTVAISTIGERINRLCLPRPRAGIVYLVLWQAPKGVTPKNLERADVLIVPLDGLGLANSRNAALSLAQTEALLFSDDDISLHLGGVAQACAALLRDPGLSFVRGWRAERFRGAMRTNADLNRLNSADICAPELMVRPKDFNALGLRFDTGYGLGAPCGLGEEFIFVADAIKAGLRGRAVPTVLGAHPHPSTGECWDVAALYGARQAVLGRVFGRWAPILRLAFVMKHRARFPTVTSKFRFALGWPVVTRARDQKTSMMSASPIREE